MNKILKISAALLGVGFSAFFYRTACSEVQPGVVRAQPPKGPSSDPAELEKHVRALAETIGPRNDEHPVAFRKAADYIAAQLKAQGLSVERQPVPVGSPPFENLIARMGPKDAPKLVIGAHYDSFGDTAGADDNASGVAGLLELARLGSTKPPKIQVELVAYALEEPPHFRTANMGSAVHAKSIKGEKILGMISLEMLGTFDDRPGSQKYPSKYLTSRYPSVANFISVVGRRADQPLVDQLRDGMSISKRMPVYGLAAPSSTMGVDFSDHLNYWAVGHKGVMVTDTAFFRSEKYHTHDDKPERLDYRRMALVVDGVFAALDLIATAPQGR